MIRVRGHHSRGEQETCPLARIRSSKTSTPTLSWRAPTAARSAPRGRLEHRDALDLWQAVCEEFGERTLGSEIDPDLVEPTMTVVTTAAAMATELTNGCHHGL